MLGIFEALFPHLALWIDLCEDQTFLHSSARDSARTYSKQTKGKNLLLGLVFHH